MELIKKKCQPYSSRNRSFTKKEASVFLVQVKDWKIKANNKNISKEFTFKTFKDSINFIKKVSVLAEKECHHPDMFVSYNKVKIDLSTKSVGGLTENDFILAAKIDGIRFF